MRNLVILSLAIIMSFGTAFASSNNTSKKSKEASTIGEIMKNAESLIDKEVVFIGMVQHVCAHSGRRAILLDETGKLSLRVEAKGEINGFNRELSGMDIRVKGILKERLTSEFIDNWEAKVKAKQDAEEGGKHCASEMTNISQMRNWMKENGKEFYSIYYVDGLSYEIVD